MEEDEILDVIYNLEEPILKINDFDNLYIYCNDLLLKCQQDMDPNLTNVDLTNMLNDLWLNGKILRFLDEEVSEYDINNPNNYKFSKVLNRDLFISNRIKSVRSRTAEIIRLLSFNRNRRKPRDPSIATLTYIKNYKKIPEWKIPILDFKKELIDEITKGINYKSKQYTVQPGIKQDLIDACEIILDGLNEFSKDKFNGPFQLSNFQAKAIKYYIWTKYFKTKINNYWSKFPYEHYVIEAGVGSGKTYAFIVGPLIDVLTQLQFKPKDGVFCLVLYPRISLVQDQYYSINKCLEYINNIANQRQKPVIKILMETAGKIKDIAGNLKSTVYRSLTPALEVCYHEIQHHIVFGTLETIKRRIINPYCSENLLSDLRTIIYDEIHLLNGLQGNHAIFFSKRLKALIGKYNNNKIPLLTFIGASATVANPIVHSSKIFGEIQKNEIIKLIRPKSNDLVESGIYHHVMLKSFKGSNLQAILTNMSSLIIHNRRNGLKNEFDPNVSVDDINKTIFFADSLNVIGRLDYLIKDNEFADCERFDQQRFPFYIWFYNPLRKHEKKVTKVMFSQLVDSCDKCKKGIPFSTSLHLTQDKKDFLSKLRSHPDRTDKVVQDIRNFLTNFNDIDVGQLDQCFYFNFGCCWWFSQDSEDREYIFRNPDILYFPGPIKCITLTSGTEEDFDEAVGSIDEYFNKPNRKLYNKSSYTKYRGMYKDFLIAHSNLNLLIASPKIEVGVDFRNVKEGIGFKAIRNLSAYHQKMGRIGRELGSDSLLVTLLSFRPEDHYYFRNNYRLTDTSYLDPIPLKGFNTSVISSQVFMAIFDFVVTENIPQYGNRLFLNLAAEARNYVSLPNKVRSVRNYFSDHQNLENLRNYLNSITNNNDIIEQAIEKFLHLMNILIYDISLVYTQANLAQALQGRRTFLTPRGTSELIDSYKQLKVLSRERLKFYTISAKTNFSQYNNILIDFFDILEKNQEFTKYKDYITNIDILDVISKFQTEVRKYQGNLKQQFQSNPNLKNELDLVTNFRKFLGELNYEVESFNEFLTNYGRRNINEQQKIYDILLKIFPLVEEYNEIIDAGEEDKKLSYFCDFYSSLNSLNVYYPFVFHPTLFQSPTLTTTKVIQNFGPSILPKVDYLPSNIVFFDLLPGTWNYRFGRLMKSPCYLFLSHNVTYVSLDRIMSSSKSEFSEMSSIQRTDFPDELPISFHSNNNEIPVLFPQTIELIRKFENPDVIISQSLVLDRDDIILDPQTYNTFRTNNNLKKLKTMPGSFPLYWYNIIYEKLEEYKYFLQLYSPKYEEILKKKPQIDKIELLLPETFDKLFNYIKFSMKFSAMKYIWSVSRSYGDRAVKPLRFFYNKEKKIAFLGDKFETDGIIIKINKDLFDEFWKEITSNKKSNQRYDSLLSQLSIQTIFMKILKFEDTNPFEANLLFQIILYAYLEKSGLIKLEPDEFITSISGLDEQYFENLIYTFDRIGYDIRTIIPYRDKLVRIKKIFDPQEFNYDDEIKERAYSIFIHTLAHKTLSAARRFLGINDDDINYFFNVAKSEIYIFDSVEGGNGSCETLKEYLYIPKIERKFQRDSKSSIIYPTSDLIYSIEENLQECKYSQSGKISFDASSLTTNLSNIILPPYFENLNADIRVNYTNGFIELADLLRNKYSDFNYDDFYMVQKACAFFLMSLNLNYNIEKLESILEICTVGCIECIIDTFSCIYGFLNSTEKLNSNLLNQFYFYIASNDPNHYGITPTDPASFNSVRLLGRDENPTKPSVSYNFIDNRSNQPLTRNYRFLKKEQLKSYMYLNLGYSQINPQNLKEIDIIGYILRRIEGERIK